MKSRLYIISIMIIAIDQITKFLAINCLPFQKQHILIPNFFSLTYTKNTGGAFSVFRGNVVLLCIIGILIFIGILIYIKKNPPQKNIEIFAFASILGGLCGNLIDRIFRKGVIDFFDFKILNYDYPIFNIADIAIVLGIILMILLEMREKQHESK